MKQKKEMELIKAIRLSNLSLVQGLHNCALLAKELSEDVIELMAVLEVKNKILDEIEKEIEDGKWDYGDG